MSRRVVNVGLALLMVYIAVCALARWRYRDLLYPGSQRVLAAARLPEMVSLPILAADGVRTFALFLDAPAGAAGPAPVVVLWHGNGEVVGDLEAHAAMLRRAGVATLLPEYRGFPGTDGVTSEPGVHADAAAALAALSALAGPRRVVLNGVSLGTGVAVAAAVRPMPTGLTLVGLQLQSPYTSIADVGADAFWFLPVRLLLPDRFDTLTLAPSVTVRTVVFHGDRDEVVPYRLGCAVAEAIPGARLVTVAGGGHNDLGARAGAAILDSLAELAAPP